MTGSLVLRPSSFVVRLPSSVVGRSSFVVRLRSSVVGRSSFVVRLPSSVVGLSSFVFRPRSFVFRPRSSVVRPSSFVFRPRSSVFRPSSFVFGPRSSVLGGPSSQTPQRPPLALQQLVGLLWPPGAGLIVRELGRRGDLPSLVDRRDQRPRCFDLVAAGEQRRVAQHGIQQQPLV